MATSRRIAYNELSESQQKRVQRFMEIAREKGLSVRISADQTTVETVTVKDGKETVGATRPISDFT